MYTVIGRTTTIVAVAGFVSGFLLLTGGTDVSVFDWWVIFVGLLSISVVGIAFWQRQLPWCRHHVPLVFFTLLTGVQFLYSDFLYTAVTLYLIGVYALVQFWHSKTHMYYHLGMGYLSGVFVCAVLGIGAYVGMIFQTTLLQNLVWSDGIRISVLFDDPVVFGAFLVPALLWGGCSFVLTANNNQRWLWASFVLIVFSVLILTASRGAWLNLCVAGTFAFMLYAPLREWVAMKRAMLLGLLAIILAAGIIYFVPIKGESFYSLTLNDRTIVSDTPRIENMQAAPGLTFDRPVREIVFGSGGGVYEVVSIEGMSPHNTYLRLLYEQGVVGLLLFVWFMYVLFTHGKDRSKLQMWQIVVLSALAGILVHNLFVDTLHWRHFWIMAGLII